MPRHLTIGSRTITDESRCYVIAEIGNNHGGRVETAIELVRMASAAGADAVKFQVRTLDRLYTAAELDRPYVNPHSYGATYGEHRRRLELSRSDLERVWASARDVGIDCFATPFDPWAVDLLLSLGVPAIKIASGDLWNTALLARVAACGVPILVSTGGAWMRDIAGVVRTLGRSRCALLHCTSLYPSAPAHLNLRAIETMRATYPESVIGYSGHDTGVLMSILAYWSGARIIEKHVTLDRAGKGSNHGMSLEPQGLAKLVEDLEKARQARGDGVKRPLPGGVEAAAVATYMGTKRLETDNDSD